MKRTFELLLAITAIAMVGSPVWAQSWEAAANHPDALKSGKSYNLMGTISGTAGTTTIGAACTQGFSNQCPSGHTCSCTQIAAADFRSSVIGNGTANIFVTEDTSAGFGLPVPSTIPFPECFPVIAEIDVTTKKDLETLDATGAICSAPKNVQIGGAFALASSNVFSVGFANFTANLNSNNGAFKLTFKGAALAK